MKRLFAVFAAVSVTLVLARCGGGGPEGPDASTSVKKDASHATGADGSTVQPGDDAATSQAGADASTPQPGDDASTTQPGADGSTVQPGADASTTQPGADASTTQPGTDASMVVTGDGGTSGPCDPFDQTGCPGQKCTVDQAGKYVCAAAGAKTDQQDCTAETDCAAGLACVGITGETGNKCRAFCSAAKACPSQNQACIVGAAGGTAAILCAVVPACDPFAATTGCGANQKCTLADTKPTYMCGPAGAKGDLETCAKDSDCSAGLVCLNFNDGFKCHALCNDPKKPCTTGQSCLGSAEGSTVAFVCLPTPDCNPLTQDCAAADQGCFPKQGGGWACFHSMGKAAGAPCEWANDCIEGYACAGSGTCMQICDPNGGAPTCTAPATCQGFITPAGVCD